MYCIVYGVAKCQTRPGDFYFQLKPNLTVTQNQYSSHIHFYLGPSPQICSCLHCYLSAISLWRCNKIKRKKESEDAQLCLTLCDPMDCRLPGSSVHGIFQARVLEWVTISFSRESSRPRDQTCVSCIAGRRFTIWATREALTTRWKRRNRKKRREDDKRKKQGGRRPRERETAMLKSESSLLFVLPPTVTSLTKVVLCHIPGLTLALLTST